MRSGSRLFGVALVAALWVLGGEPQPRAFAIDGATQWSVYGHWYKYVQSGSIDLTWDSAKANAEALGGHLVTLTSAEEQAWVHTTLHNVAAQGGCFLGGNDVAGLLRSRSRVLHV